MVKAIEYSSEDLIKSLYNSLTLNGNPAAYHYYEKDHLWKILEKAIRDEDFMSIVIFNNDYLKIAPTHTFSSYYIDDKVELTSFEKNSVGRVFKYVFEILGYSKEQRVYRKSTSIHYGKVFE